MKKTPLQQYEDGDITAQRMFALQDEETAYRCFVGALGLASVFILFGVYKLLRFFF